LWNGCGIDHGASGQSLNHGCELNQVQTRVKKLREIASQDSTVVQQGFKKIQLEAVSANGWLNAFITNTDISSVEDSTALTAKVSRMKEILQSWCVILRLLPYVGRDTV